MNCIFCDKLSHDSRSVEHIVPESLGNKKFILPKGTVCDECNQYFSKKIEQPLLDLPFFKSNRHKLNIQNKKGKIPSDYGFAINPETKVEFHKNKNGEQSISFKDDKALQKILNRKNLEVFMPIFGGIGQNNMIVSKFLGKLAIENLALICLENEHDAYQELSKHYYQPLKKYIRNAAKNEFWPYHERVLHGPDYLHKYNDKTEYFQITFAMEYIYTTQKLLFFQFLFLGTEYTIDMTNKTTHTILEWFAENNSMSPVLEVTINAAVAANGN